MSAIVVEGLAKRFGDRTAVEGLSFEVAPGEIFGLLGPNGSGKTTTVRLLAGLLTPSAGRAWVCGVELPLRDEGVQLRQRIGLLTEQPGLYERLTATENLLFFIRLHELDEAAAMARASQTLRRLGLEGRTEEPVGGFSKGMRQKLAIVRTLLHRPQVVFLDEPTSGLDPQSAHAVREVVAEVARQGCAVVLCSHNLTEVERLCTNVAVIKNRLRTVASLKELRREGTMLEIGLEGDAARWVSLLGKLAFAPRAHAEGGLLKVVLSAQSQTPAVVAHLVAHGAQVHSVRRAERPLEEAYLDLVRDEAEEAEAAP